MRVYADSIFIAALPQLSAEFHATTTITNLSVAMYMLSMSIFPLWWSSFSETLGRRTIYLVSFALFVLWSIVSAISTSIGMLIVMRILGGGAAASVQAVGAGTIADIWESRERGRAMGIFYLGPLMGPLLAPIIGGVLCENLGWRSTMWFLVIYGGLLWLVLCFCLPETLGAKKPLVATTALPSHNDEKGAKRLPLTRISTRQSVQQKAHAFATVFKRFIIDPLSVLAYLRFPAVAITVYYASITFGSLYVLNISVQQTFSSAPYGFSTTIIGLLYIPSSLGYIVASVIGGKWSDTIMHREARRANRYDTNGKLILIPEDRMRENAYLAAAIYPAALIWYGWAVKYHLYWAIPAVANFFFGLGSMVIFSVSTTMLTEFMPKRSSSGVAVNNFIRNIFSCVGGIVASPLIDAIGNGWLFTGLGIIAWFSGFVVWAMRRYGPRWREQMDKALNG
jgi:multidrug resistance protein